MKPKLSILFAALFALFALLCSCTAQSQTEGEYYDDVFFAMDTYVTVRLARVGQTEDSLSAVRDECERIVAELEETLTSHSPNGEVYALNESGAETCTVSPTLAAVLSEAVELSELTDGAFDFTLGRLTELWNVTGGGPVPSVRDIEEALSHVGCESVTVTVVSGEDGGTVSRSDTNVSIDLGGVGKGAAADALIEYLSGTDVSHGLVSVGGTIGVFGEKPNGEPYLIGIRSPEDAGEVIGYLRVCDGFVSVSGDYERYFEEEGVRYHHILDRATGRPADSGLCETAVYAERGAVADALSTALFVMGRDRSLELYERGDIAFEAVLVSTDGAVTATDGAELEPLE